MSRLAALVARWSPRLVALTFLILLAAAAGEIR